MHACSFRWLRAKVTFALAVGAPFLVALATAQVANTPLPAPLSILQTSDAAADGYIFYTQQGGAQGTRGPVIVDRAGRPVWYLPIASGTAADFRVQTYHGRRVLTWAQGIGFQNPTPNSGIDYIYDETYQKIAEVRAGNGLSSDLHEFELTPEDTALITIYDVVPWDLSSVGGPPAGAVLESTIQEIDVATGTVLFEWHSLDHVGLAESLFSPTGIGPFDYFHINSIKVDYDGNLIVSARNTSALYKINRETGDILWRLGGKRSDFTLPPGISFALQHNATVETATTIRIFDNEASAPSHIMWLDRNEATRQVNTRIWTHPSRIFAATEGGAQSLPNGNLFVGWGSAGAISEFDAQGTLLFDARFPLGFNTYRAVKMPWTGRPATNPQVAALRNDDQTTTVHAIWNGATEVAIWRVLGSLDGAETSELASMPWAGLDTSVTLSGDLANVSVAAYDSNGQLLGTSDEVSGTFPLSAPTIVTEAASYTVAPGTTVVLSIAAKNAASYQWRSNGVFLSDSAAGPTTIQGATTPRLVLSAPTSPGVSRYSCIVTNESGTVTSKPVTLTVLADGAPSRLTNVSCRSFVGSGENALITGFVVAGPPATGAADIAVRASGLALKQFGVSGYLPDPQLALYNLDQGSAPIAVRSAGDSTGPATWPSPLAITLPHRDAYIAKALSPANYSANVTSPSGSSGVAMIEVDDLDSESATLKPTHLVNCSGRAYVGTGANVLVLGFTITGSTARTVLLRGAGPALAAYGVQGTLQDPKLALYDATGRLMATNEDWDGDAVVAKTGRDVGAFGWADPTSKDAALLLTLPPGAYTAQVSGTDGGTGVAIVEVYDVP